MTSGGAQPDNYPFKGNTLWPLSGPTHLPRLQQSASPGAGENHHHRHCLSSLWSQLKVQISQHQPKVESRSSLIIDAGNQSMDGWSKVSWDLIKTCCWPCGAEVSDVWWQNIWWQCWPGVPVCQYYRDNGSRQWHNPSLLSSQHYPDNWLSFVWFVETDKIVKNGDVSWQAVCRGGGDSQWATLLWQWCASTSAVLTQTGQWTPCGYPGVWPAHVTGSLQVITDHDHHCDHHWPQ